MPSLVVTNAVLVRLIWSAGGQPFQINVLGSRKIGATSITQTVADQLFAGFKALLTSSGLAAQLDSTVSLTSVGVRDIGQPNMVEFTGTGTPGAGTAAGGKKLPPQTALVITERTAAAGKSFRGRMYVGGFNDVANLASGVASPACVTAVTSFGGGIDGTLNPSGLRFAVVSRARLVVTDVTGVQVRDNIWDTIRRRAIPGI